MDEFLIPSTTGSGGLAFSNREPADHTDPIAKFFVRVTERDLSAAAEVYDGFVPHPGSLFTEMASQWSGWSGELVWESFENELILRCTHDRLGHVSIRVELRSGPTNEDWRVEATVAVEAGQLESIARRAESFFGRGPATRLCG